MAGTSRFGRTTSRFSDNKTKFSSISFSPDDTKVDNITDDTVIIFYAPWCGHCKRSMSDFKQAVTQGNGKVVLVNSDNEPDLVKKYNVNGFPTIMKGNGSKYTGNRDYNSIISFANDD
jgi:thiol-disulfide isomerase/thioredoxin